MSKWKKLLGRRETKLFRKFVLFSFVKKETRWIDIPQEHIDKVSKKFVVTKRDDNDKYLKINIKDTKYIDPDRLKRKTNKAKFVSQNVVGDLNDEKIAKLNLMIKNEVIPYSLLPIDIFKAGEGYKINWPEELATKFIEQIKISTQNMESETEIGWPLPNDLKDKITSALKLPGQQRFFQSLRSKDYYFNQNYSFENSISIKNSEIKMRVSVFNSDVIIKDLEQYISSIK